MQKKESEKKNQKKRKPLRFLLVFFHPFSEFLFLLSQRLNAVSVRVRFTCIVLEEISVRAGKSIILIVIKFDKSLLISVIPACLIRHHYHDGRQCLLAFAVIPAINTSDAHFPGRLLPFKVLVMQESFALLREPLSVFCNVDNSRRESSANLFFFFPDCPTTTAYQLICTICSYSNRSFPPGIIIFSW